MNGTGWRVRAKGGKVQVTRADEDGRSSVMLDLPWHPNSKLKILAAVEQLHKRMNQLGCSLRHAHDLANNCGQTISGKLDWFAVRDQFLETVADRRAATKKDIAFRAQRTLEAMESKPRPKDGTEVLLRYADLFLGNLESGSSGRKRNIDDAARFLRFGVERCGANAKWMPPTSDRRREIVGAADAFHDEAKGEHVTLVENIRCVADQCQPQLLPSDSCRNIARGVQIHQGESERSRLRSP